MSIASRLAALVLLLVFAGCGGGGSSTDEAGAGGPLDEPPLDSSPCDVALDAVGWDSALLAVFERDDYTPSPQPLFPFSTPSVSSVAKSVTKLLAGKIPAVGGVASEVIDLFWPAGDSGELERIVDAKIEEALTGERLRAALEDARAWLAGLRSASSQYRGRMENDTTPQEQLDAWENLEPLLDLAGPKFEIEEFRVELAGLYAQLATLQLLHLDDGVRFLGTRWPASPGEVTRVRQKLDGLIEKHQDHLLDVYHDGLLRAGNAEAALILAEYRERRRSGVEHRLDHAQRLWTALNRFRREYTLSSLDLSDAWSGLRAGADRNVRLTREIYSDPVGYLPTSYPRENDEYFLLPKRTAPFGVDGSLMKDVRAALAKPKYVLVPNSVIIQSFQVVYPDGTSSGVSITMNWTQLPGLQWVTDARAQTLGPDERLERIDVTAGFDSRRLIAFGNPAFRVNRRTDPAHAPVRDELRLTAYDPAMELPFLDPIHVELCNPIVRVSGESRRFVEGYPSSAGSSSFDGRYRSASTVELSLIRRHDAPGEGVRIRTMYDANTNLYPAVDLNHFAHGVVEPFDFAFPGHVLSNVITIDAEDPLAHEQAVIFAFRRADSYSDE